MTYWAREHDYNLRRIGDAIRELDAVYEEILPPLIHDMVDDDAQATFPARLCLATAKDLIAQAMTALDSARKALPEPQRGPRFPTAAEVMEREA